MRLHRIQLMIALNNDNEEGEREGDNEEGEREGDSEEGECEGDSAPWG